MGYVHCSRGLIKIGTGDQNTRKWEFYGCRSYRNGEHVQLVWVDGKIYARSAQMKFGVVEVIDCGTLEMQYSIFLGIDCNVSIPQLWKTKDLPMITDGLYLYLVSYEEDWAEYYQKVKDYKIKMEEEQKRLEIERKAREKLRKERKVGITKEMIKKYKAQKKKKNKNKKPLFKFDKSKKDESLPPNDKQTQTEESLMTNSQQTQTEEIALDIVNSLIDNVVNDENKSNVVTEHIRSVKSTKKILGINTLTTELPKEAVSEIVNEIGAEFDKLQKIISDHENKQDEASKPTKVEKSDKKRKKRSHKKSKSKKKESSKERMIRKTMEKEAKKKHHK